MEALFYLIIIYGGFAFIVWFSDKIEKWNSKRKSNVRNDVANEVLSKTDITKELIQEYKNKLTEIGYTKQGDGWFYNYYLSDGMKSVMNSVGEPCPSCKEGHLRLIKGKYGKFLGCSNYPKCKYKKSLAIAKKENQEKSVQLFYKLFNLAYK